MHQACWAVFLFGALDMAEATGDRGSLYPIGLKVAGRNCLVVGEGPAAQRKAQELRECGAIVRAIDDAFAPSDLDDVCVVIAATDEARLQEAVASAAAARGVPCNVVDVNHLCTFYAPAVLRRGDVTVSVATHGKFPLLAVAIRDRMAAA